MSFERFVELVEKRLQELLGKKQSVSLRTVAKNNGSRRVGIVIRDPDVNISPTIYLEEYFELYESGSSLEEIGRQICSLYHQVKLTHSWEGEFLSDYEKVRSRIIYRLISRRRNREYLETVPYVPFLDMAVIFYVMLELDDEDKSAVMLVENMHLEVWDVDAKEIYKEACENTKRLLPAEFAPMQTLICEMDMENEDEEEEEQEEEDAYILTNSSRNFGAAAILYDSCLQRIGDYLEEDFYVMPSSIHEVIILPVSMAPSWRELDLIVRDMNQTMLKAEDVLSDRTYFYSREKEKLTLPEQP